MKPVYYYIIGVLAVIGIASCSSGRRTVQDKLSVTSEWKTDESVVARANVRFEPSKGKGANVGGVLRMKRDDVIQLNLTYILGIQIENKLLSGIAERSRKNKKRVCRPQTEAASSCMLRSLCFISD